MEDYHVHAHDHDLSIDADGTGKHCPMIMTFHGGHCEHILWKSWTASTITEFVFSALAIFLFAIMYEALKFLREYFRRETIRKESERATIELQAQPKSKLPTGDNTTTTDIMNVRSGSIGSRILPNVELITEFREKTYIQCIFSSSHIIQTILNLLQIIIAYILMLIFMTYNYWLCLAVILGLGTGFFFFGWYKRDVYENECCQ